MKFLLQKAASLEYLINVKRENFSRLGNRMHGLTLPSASLPHELQLPQSRDGLGSGREDQRQGSDPENNQECQISLKLRTKN